MVIVNGNDFFSVKCGSLIADYDKSTLINLYQPMIGYEATALYLSLFEEARNQEVLSLSTHETFFNRMRMNSQTFMDAREKLEGIGLLKTKLEDNGMKIFHYELRAPLVPSKFFDNPLFTGLLTSSIGEEETEKLRSLYYVTEEKSEGEDITTSFPEAFHPDLDSGIFTVKSPDKKVKTRRGAHVNTDFDLDLFFTHARYLMGGNGFNDDSLSKEELKQIESILTLNAIGEEQGAEIIVKIYDKEKPKGQRIDFNQLFNQVTIYHHSRMLYAPKKESQPEKVSSSSKLGERINLCETLSPTEYLSRLQGYTSLADADVKLINYISVKYGLAHSVMNALLSFTLDRCNNTLPLQYCDKVAAALQREKVSCAKDAFEYLYNSTSSHKLVAPKSLSNEPKEEEEISQEAWDALIDKIHGKD